MSMMRFVIVLLNELWIRVYRGLAWSSSWSASCLSLMPPTGFSLLP